MYGKDITEKISEVLLESCKKYFQENLPDTPFPEGVDVCLQPARDAKHGDLTSNIAMRLARSAKRPPKDLAEGFAAAFLSAIENNELSSHIEFAGSAGGFINFKFSSGYFHTMLRDLYAAKGDFGRSESGDAKKINLEYVSANPTGPLTIAHGRQAAIGDTLARILRFAGYDVTSEYYLNDCGRQIRMLARSVEVRYRNLFGEDEEMPDDGYMGDYIIDIARQIKKEKGDSLLEESVETEIYFKDHAVKYMMGLIEKDLEDFGVDFDVWTSQEKLEGEDEVPKTLELLKDAGYIFEEEGATWFSSTKLGDDKDRVVIKSDGSYTYLAPDIAYHLDKYRRGYDVLIDLLGPDHHGYIKRMKAAVQALGKDKGSLNILIVQLVTLLRGGEALSMSTRKGEFLSLREILDELGKDVTRFFFLSRRLDSHLDFDIELAKKESADNPVFYIQYAHARICSIHKFSEEKWPDISFRDAALDRLSTGQEDLLIRKMSEFPKAVISSAESLEPNRLIVYLNELARSFHSFYTECRVVSDDAELSKARLFLVECVRIVLANGLGLLNITLPEKM